MDSAACRTAVGKHIIYVIIPPVPELRLKLDDNDNLQISAFKGYTFCIWSSPGKKTYWGNCYQDNYSWEAGRLGDHTGGSNFTPIFFMGLLLTGEWGLVGSIQTTFKYCNVHALQFCPANANNFCILQLWRTTVLPYGCFCNCECKQLSHSETLVQYRFALQLFLQWEVSIFPTGSLRRFLGITDGKRNFCTSVSGHFKPV